MLRVRRVIADGHYHRLGSVAAVGTQPRAINVHDNGNKNGAWSCLYLRWIAVHRKPIVHTPFRLLPPFPCVELRVLAHALGFSTLERR